MKLPAGKRLTLENYRRIHDFSQAVWVNTFTEVCDWTALTSEDAGRIAKAAERAVEKELIGLLAVDDPLSPEAQEKQTDGN